MGRLKVTITIDSVPAKRIYVEHLVFGIPGNVYITDNEGQVRDNFGNLGIDSFTGEADIRILAQNSVAKAVQPVPLIGTLLPDWSDHKIKDGSVVNIPSSGDRGSRFRILTLATKNYDEVHSQFAPFATAPSKDFPLGRQRDLRATKDQSRRIEIVFPDNLVVVEHVTFVEPKQLSTGYPLIHIVDDGSLFGDPNHRQTLIPSELAHALHFSFFTEAMRGHITAEYMTFIMSDIVAMGHKGEHNLPKRTTPLVAYVEAMDHFSHRYSEFLATDAAKAESTSNNRRKAFVDIEIKAGGYWLHDAQNDNRSMSQVGVLDSVSDKVIPQDSAFKGSDNEGAVYGAIFLDFAHRTSLKEAVDAYHLSLALSFGEYKNWVESHMPQHRDKIAEVAKTWGM